MSFNLISLALFVALHVNNGVSSVLVAMQN